MSVRDYSAMNGIIALGSRANGPNRPKTKGRRLAVLFDEATFEVIRFRAKLSGKSLATEVRKLVAAGFESA